MSGKRYRNLRDEDIGRIRMEQDIQVRKDAADLLEAAAAPGGSGTVTCFKNRTDMGDSRTLKAGGHSITVPVIGREAARWRDALEYLVRNGMARDEGTFAVELTSLGWMTGDLVRAERRKDIENTHMEDTALPQP